MRGDEGPDFQVDHYSLAVIEAQGITMICAFQVQRDDWHTYRRYSKRE